MSVYLQEPRLRLLERHFGDGAVPNTPDGDRREQVGKRRLRLLDVGGVADADLHSAAAAGKAGIADLGVAQLGADFVARRVAAAR